MHCIVYSFAISRSVSQMTHSIDSFITDSANSATALYTGKKSSVNALNVYADSVCFPSSLSLSFALK